MLKLKCQYFGTWWEELTHWKRPWCWERLKAGGERDDRGWDGWMGSPTRRTWVWTNSGRWWYIGRPGMLRFMGSWRVGHDWATELTDCLMWRVRPLASLIRSWLLAGRTWGEASCKEDLKLEWGPWDLIRNTFLGSPWLTVILRAVTPSPYLLARNKELLM